MIKVLVSLLILLVFSLTGCATAKAPSSQDSEAKRFEPAAGKANLYLVRKSESFGSLVGFQWGLDGKDEGSLSPGTYQLVSLEPGKHKIDVHAGLNSTSLDFDADAGKNYFYETGAKAGSALIQPEISLVLLEPMGKLMVSQFSRAPVMTQ